jgi:hypothetical protein
MVIANNIPLDIKEVLRTRARSVYMYRINFQEVGFLTLNKMRQWCEDNCKGLWRAESVYALYWQFEDEHDATMFMLKWATAEGNKLK